MNNGWKKYSIISTVISIIAITVLSIFLFRSCNAPQKPVEIEVHDTLLITKHDTCWKDTVIYRTKWDTLLVIEKDSIKDTIKLELPIEHKQASFKTSRDSIDIEADIYYHGFKAEVDSTAIRYNFHWTEQIPEPKKKKFGWCITVGPSVNLGFNYDMVGNRVGAGPGLGVSVVIGPSYIIK